MAYSKNILPDEAAYYKLQNASISNGILSLQAGGIAYIDLDKTFLTSLPSSILLNFYISIDVDPLEPEVCVFLDTTLTNGTAQNFVVYPISVQGGTSSIIVKCIDGDYEHFRFCIKAQKACNFLLWELCPQQESDITTIIEGVEQSLPHVLYDYNTWQLQVQQEEMTIGMIACYLLGNTDVNGHFSLDFYSSEYCNVYIRFRDNEITELYTPMLFTVNPGHNTIGIPHAYLKRLAGIHNFVVTCQCTNGELTIYPRGLLYSIDAGYLAERLIDAGLDIMDLAIKQTKVDASPEELWCIGLDAGEILVKSRVYNTQANTAWTPRYSMGKGLTAAIEFDGEWVLRSDNVTYTIETEEIPYIFVVEEDGTLVVYKGDDFTSRAILDSNVSQISVVRGYKSSIYPEQDQGLIVAYLKEGKAYYRQFVYFQSTGNFKWDTAKELDENINTYVYVQRLNDYRVGFLTSNEQNNMWYISDRTYVNQAVQPEYEYMSVDLIDSLTNYVNTVNTGIPCVFEDVHASQQTFFITYTYPLVYIDREIYTEEGQLLTMKDFFKLTVNDTPVNIQEVRLQDSILYVTAEKEISWTRQSNAVIKLFIDNSNRNFYIQTEKDKYLGLFIASEIFSWTIERVITTVTIEVEEESESINCAITTSLQVLDKKTTENLSTEKYPISVNIQGTGVVSTVTIKQELVTEVEDLQNISIMGSVTMTQTGTSPI